MTEHCRMRHPWKSDAYEGAIGPRLKTRTGKAVGTGTNSGKNQMSVPYDKWGDDWKAWDHPVYDSEGNKIGVIEDRIVYIQEEDIRPATKKEVLADIDGWRMDDGTYGDEDTKICFAYKDGTFVSADDLNGKAYKKTGLVGVSISTGDYEMVWGGEMHNGSVRPWQTWSPDGESGHSNSYSGYKATGAYKERVRITYNNPGPNGTYKTKREVIRRSTTKAM